MPTVLQIDSDPVSSERMARTLRAGGYSTMRAQTGLDGVEIARKSVPDVVIVCAPLPDLDAHTVTLRLRAIPSWTDRAIVIVDDTADVQAALAVGASGHIRRDAPPAVLVRDLGRYVRGVRERPDQSSEFRLRKFSQRIAADLEVRMRALIAANRDLEHLGRVRTEFLRNVSHELATPITPAIGYVELLRNGSLGPLNPGQQSVLDSLAQSLDRLQHVTGVMREVSALENHELKPRFSVFNLGRFVKTFRETWESRAQLDVVSVGTETEVVGDAALLGRALGRVVENAVKFGGPNVRVGVRFDADDERVRFVVTDTGSGIPPERLERLGDLFHQVDGSPTRRYGGVGLGLAYAKRVMHAHDGTLVVESPVVQRVSEARTASSDVSSAASGSGTEVRLEFPRRDATPTRVA